jgi:hypothetical protein
MAPRANWKGYREILVEQSLQRAPISEIRCVQRAWAADTNHQSWPAFSGFTRAGLFSFNAHMCLRFNMSRNSGVVKDRRAPRVYRRRRRSGGGGASGARCQIVPLSN